MAPNKPVQSTLPAACAADRWCWATTKGIERAMAKHAKMLQWILLGRSDANFAFADLRGLLQELGFDERIRGDHQIFARNAVAEIVNLH